MAHTSSRHPTIAKGAYDRCRDHWRDQRREFVDEREGSIRDNPYRPIDLSTGEPPSEAMAMGNRVTGSKNEGVQNAFQSVVRRSFRVRALLEMLQKLGVNVKGEDA
eukprot:12549208-Heterocapsa_arctica.AAC.1